MLCTSCSTIPYTSLKAKAPVVTPLVKVVINPKPYSTLPFIYPPHPEKYTWTLQMCTNLVNPVWKDIQTYTPNQIPNGTQTITNKSSIAFYRMKGL